MPLICPICQKEYQKLDAHHINRHGLSKQEYFEKYGEDAPFGYSEELRQKKSGENHPLFGIGHSEETKKKLSASTKKMWEETGGTEAQRSAIGKYSHHVAEEGNHFNKGIKRTEEEIEIIKEKSKQTSLLRYGVENPMLCKELQEKRKQTNLDRYGVEYVSQSPEIRSKIIDTNLERYGVENISQCQDVKDRVQISYKETCLEKYGVEHVMQDPEMFQKISLSTFKKKLYVFPSGKEVKVMGYENFIIDYLLFIGYNENEIEVEHNLSIPYEFENKTKMYHPDIFIPKDNLIIEVKSTYTVTCDIEKNKAKALGTINAGYNFRLLVWDDIEKKSYSFMKL